MKKTKAVKQEPKWSSDNSGLTERQAEFIAAMMMNITEAFEKEDDKERHFAVIVLTREGHDEQGDYVSTSLVSSMEREYLHHILRQWLHRETQ